VRVYFMGEEGRLRPGDDCGLEPEHVAFSVDVDGCLVGRIRSRPQVEWALRVNLKGTSRAQAERLIYEAFRVKLASEHPFREESGA
jgi:hypothetical protein